MPQRGDRRRLIEQAARNAGEELDRRLAESTTQAKLLREMADLFELAEPPERIEVYDNSHILGTNALGAMVVAGPEGFRKSAVSQVQHQARRDSAGRRFRDDARGVRAPLRPREEEDPDRTKGEWPDLVLIDGGKGQLSAVARCSRNSGSRTCRWSASPRGPIAMPAARCSIIPTGASSRCRRTRRCCSTSSGCATRRTASRSARTGRSARRRSATSPLDEVPGIGPARKRALLMHFGTGRAVRGASLEDLQKAPGVSAAVAQAVYDFYHSGS